MDSQVNRMQESSKKLFKLKTRFLKTLLAADLHSDYGFVSNTTEKIGKPFFEKKTNFTSTECVMDLDKVIWKNWFNHLARANFSI
jgi:hypothetical protein